MEEEIIEENPDSEVKDVPSPEKVEEGSEVVEEVKEDSPPEADFEGADTMEDIPKGKEKDYGI